MPKKVKHLSSKWKKNIGSANAVLMKTKWQDPEYRVHMSMVHKGKASPMKGKFTSTRYLAIHMWLQRNFEKVCCFFCGVVGKRLEWALKKGERYEHKRENFLPLCVSCHKKYDYTDEHKKKISKAMTGRKVTWMDKVWKTRRLKLALHLR